MLWSICWCCCLYHHFPAGACPQHHWDENLAFGYVNPQLQCGKTQSSGFLSQWPVYKLRESSMTQLKIPYNLPHNKIIAEELHKEFPVGLNPGKYFGLAHPNSNFTTERSKTESCGWKRKRISLMQTPGKDQLTSVIVLFFLEGPCVKYEDTSFSFFLIVIVIKNIFLIIHGLQWERRETTDSSRSSPRAPAQFFTTKSPCSHDWQHKHQFVHWKVCLFHCCTCVFLITSAQTQQHSWGKQLLSNIQFRAAIKHWDVQT